MVKLMEKEFRKMVVVVAVVVRIVRLDVVEEDELMACSSPRFKFLLISLGRKVGVLRNVAIFFIIKIASPSPGGGRERGDMSKVM